MKGQGAAMNKSHRGEPRRFKIRYLFLGLLVLLLVWFAIFRIGAYRDLNGRMAELEQAGYPLTLAELGQAHSIDPAFDNGADYYLAAFSHYREPNDAANEILPWVGKADKPARTEPLDPALLQAIEAFLGENEKALSLLHEAVELEYARYPMDFSQGFDMLSPWLKEMRRCAFLLSLEGLAACAQDDPNRAIETVHATLALAKSQDCPVIINRLVQIAIRALAYSNIEQVVNRVTLTDAQLQTVSGWVQTYVNPDGYRQTLIGERCFGLQMFRAPGEMSPDMGGGRIVSVVLVPLKVLGLYDRDVLSYINLMQDYIDALELPQGERLAAYQAVEERFSSGKGLGLLTRIIMPALMRTYQLETRNIARRRVTWTALAAERFRLAEGRLPTTLDELVPTYLDAVPIDPFDGQPLRYRLLEKGFLVYSIGEDNSDDGGAERDRDSRHPDGSLKWDINFFVER